MNVVRFTTSPRQAFSVSLLHLVTLSALHLVTVSGQEPAAFFNQHCTKCHGAEKQKGDLRLDALPTDPETWLEIADRLEFGEMPPEDEPQPKAADAAAIIALAKKQASQAAKSHQVVLRRLNRKQYRNTLRDLLHIDTIVEDPTASFPADDEEHGFDNLGETLQMSDFLLRQYLQVAQKAIADATYTGEKPEPQTFAMGDEKKGRTRVHNWRNQRGTHPERDYAILYESDERAPGDPRGQSMLNAREGVTHDGWYDFTFVVESRGRGNLSDRFGQDTRIDRPIYRPEDLHRFEFYLTKPSKETQVQTRHRVLVKSWDLPDNKRVTIKQRVWLKAAWRVEIAFGNGYAGIRDPMQLVDPDFDRDAFRELPKREQNETYGPTIVEKFEATDGPRIVVHEAVETGPIFEEWPPKSHQIVHTDDLLSFAERAFRRPVTEDEIRPFVRLAESSPDGTKAAITAMLCSPRFIYLDEPEGELDHFALASRLSYFLWNTMPDEALYADAKAGKLKEPAILQKHLDRMLKDERSDEFVDSFLWAWLRLEKQRRDGPGSDEIPGLSSPTDRRSDGRGNQLVLQTCNRRKPVIGHVFGFGFQLHQLGPRPPLRPGSEGRDHGGISESFPNKQPKSGRFVRASIRPYHVGQRRRYLTGRTRHLDSGEP